MPNRLLRPFLLKLLLLAVCFHAAVGAALHEARHFDSLAQRVVQLQETGTAHYTEAPQPEADALCAWCTAFAVQIAQAGVPPGVPPAVHIGAVRHVADAPGIVARPLRWSFAARDPPALQG